MKVKGSKRENACVLSLLFLLSPLMSSNFVKFKHLSSKNGDLPEPNGGRQQTACVVFDIDKDGSDDIVIGERTKPPALIWITKKGKTWRKYVIEGSHKRPEAGGTSFDIDGDGDLDLVIGGDAGSNELWWYENPYPDFQSKRSWKVHYIKREGRTAHHDQVFGNFKGTARTELAFWNQGAKKLFLAEIPKNPRRAKAWPYVEIFDYSRIRSRIKQEGAFAYDIDRDGKVDILAGQFWFKHLGGNRFKAIKVSDRPGRIAAAMFKSDRYPQIVVAPGDGNGPLWFIECTGDPLKEKSWKRRSLLGREVISGHTLETGDINGDGHMDIFCAEMHTPGNKDKCTAWILYGDGRGNFKVQALSVGIGNHDSRLADVNGDGRLDIVTKPYTWDTPRIDVWLNLGS